MLRNWPAVTQIENDRGPFRTPDPWASTGVGPLSHPLVASPTAQEGKKWA